MSKSSQSWWEKLADQCDQVLSYLYKIELYETFFSEAQIKEHYQYSIELLLSGELGFVKIHRQVMVRMVERLECLKYTFLLFDKPSVFAKASDPFLIQPWMLQVQPCGLYKILCDLLSAESFTSLKTDFTQPLSN